MPRVVRDNVLAMLEQAGAGRLDFPQLAAIYERLLSWKAVVADRDLGQVKPKGSTIGDDGVSPFWFVPKERLAEFRGDEIVDRAPGVPAICEKGRFALYPSSVSRRQTGSYYTPDVLVRCLVDETLRELLKGHQPADADRLLRLKVCEPAMGSGAFLSEAVDQIAHRYLELKQRQLGRLIAPGQYPQEHRRVKLYLAARNAYGVDLDEMAVELAGFAFSDAAQSGLATHLRAGNSLIGARRAVWTRGQLAAGQHGGSRAGRPRLLRPGESRGREEIYHFLVFDPDMVPAARAPWIKRLWPSPCREAAAWIAEEVRPGWAQADLDEAADLSGQIDEHWQRHADQRRTAIACAGPSDGVWPEPTRPGSESSTVADSDGRLAQVMDAWCALWFWAPERADQLPGRRSWLKGVREVLGQCDAEAAWQSTVRCVAERERFFHWELAFPEILGPAPEQPGFDLIVGNPPWQKVSCSDADWLREMDPLLGVRQARSAELSRNRGRLLENVENRRLYADRLQTILGTVAFLKSRRLYPELAGVQTNLYKSFLLRSWDLLAPSGVGGLLHQENAFEDPNGGAFRAAYYCRLLTHYQFRNERLLFPDVGHPESFSINVFRGQAGEPHFTSISNLFHPDTIARCRDGSAASVPGIRAADGCWETAGHPSRRITVTRRELTGFARLLQGPASPVLHTRLPQVHSREILSVIEVLARWPRRLAELSGAYKGTVMFDEAYAQQKGLITRQDDPAFQPQSAGDWVVSGPHFYVGTPFAKTCRSACIEKNHYDEIDLTGIPRSYLPLAVHRPGDARGDRSRFAESAGKAWPQDGAALVTRYRHAHRRRGNPGVERTLVSCILPPGCTHIDAVYTIAFADQRTMLAFSAATYSLCFDFLVRLTGKRDFRADVAGMLPLLDGPLVEPLVHRALRLNCLSEDYAQLWTEAAGPRIREDRWTSQDPRVGDVHELAWSALDPSCWQWKTPLRSDLARRQALLEIDVLVAMALGLTLQQLVMLYRVQFPVMRSHEMADQYDARGRRVPNTARRNQGASQFAQAVRQWDGHAPLTVSWPTDRGLGTATKVFHPPWTGVDREEDYARAYDAFRARYLDG